MNVNRYQLSGALALFAAALLVFVPVDASAAIQGITGKVFNFTARAAQLSTGEGGSVRFWGFQDDDDKDGDGLVTPQYPGPTLILNEGQTVKINLTNELPMPVSIVVPGHPVLATAKAAPTKQGLMTLEVRPGGKASYQFRASDPGTFYYQSGTRPELQIEMGLIGAIVVRPTGYSASAPKAYGHTDSRYEREFLFFISEMDSRIHHIVEHEGVGALKQEDYLNNYFANYWFVNGRTAPDTLFPDNVSWLPTQPYGAIAFMHPGDRVLQRIIGAGRDMHPFHPHGSHSRVIARDGSLLSSGGGRGADLAYEVFTHSVVPGATYDAIFEWTGEKLGWDMYGSTLDDPARAHNCIDTVNNRTGAPGADGYADAGSDFPWEYCADHNKAFPVVMPDKLEMAFGGFWGGSVYLGSLEQLPPGEGGLNPNGGYTFLWHSHTEKELINFDVFPGGLLTLVLIESPTVPLP